MKWNSRDRWRERKIRCEEEQISFSSSSSVDWRRTGNLLSLRDHDRPSALIAYEKSARLSIWNERNRLLQLVLVGLSWSNWTDTQWRFEWRTPPLRSSRCSPLEKFELYRPRFNYIQSTIFTTIGKDSNLDERIELIVEGWSFTIVIRFDKNSFSLCSSVGLHQCLISQISFHTGIFSHSDPMYGQSNALSLRCWFGWRTKIQRMVLFTLVTSEMHWWALFLDGFEFFPLSFPSSRQTDQRGENRSSLRWTWIRHFGKRNAVAAANVLVSSQWGDAWRDHSMLSSFAWWLIEKIVHRSN